MYNLLHESTYVDSFIRVHINNDDKLKMLEEFLEEMSNLNLQEYNKKIIS